MAVPFVSVDPILDDSYYEIDRSDAHFTGSPVFVESKADMFARLRNGCGGTSGMHGVVFTAPGSRQSEFIQPYVESIDRPLLLAISADPAITRHEEVAPAVLGPTVAAVNSLLLGWELPTGVCVV